MSVRLRFAPSPTGHLHIGGLRTAIFNWLFARHHGGQFLVRIEDTDIERSRQEYTHSILESLEWMGLTSDEPIVIQSERASEHARVLEYLIQEGKAYRCYCTPEHVKERLRAAGQSDEFVQYDRYCLQAVRDTEGLPYAIRFKLPDFKSRGQRTIDFDDHIRGRVSFPVEQFDDFVIARSDGTPMYNFVVVVDDAWSRITHIVRGEDHISNTPKQLLLYEALGYPVPEFAHIPMILNEQGARLSKRDAATSVTAYRLDGYGAHPLFIYLVRLGWAHGDQEHFTQEELIQLFTLEAVGKKGSVFDVAKLAWFNSTYMRTLSSEEIITLIIRDIDPLFCTSLALWSRDQIRAGCALYVERSKTLAECARAVLSLYTEPSLYESVGVARWVTPQTPHQLKVLINRLAACTQEEWAAELLVKVVKAVCTEFGLQLPLIAQPIRLALTGTTESPGVYGLLAVLGKDESIKRLETFIASIQALEGVT
jgi:glutamyl-tRNA synthetase